VPVGSSVVASSFTADEVTTGRSVEAERSEPEVCSNDVGSPLGSEAWADELPVAAPDIPAPDVGTREDKPSVGVALAPKVLSLVGIPEPWLAVAVGIRDDKPSVESADPWPVVDERVTSERSIVGIGVA
jgi:hypothetical protein